MRKERHVFDASYSTGTAGGSLVVQIVGLVTFALLVGIWVVGLVEQMRRDRQAVELRTARRARHLPALRTAQVITPVWAVRVPERRMGDRARQQTSTGDIDEFSQLAESVGMRQ
jgi:hypothetical protein